MKSHLSGYTGIKSLLLLLYIIIIIIIIIHYYYNYYLFIISRVSPELYGDFLHLLLRYNILILLAAFLVHEWLKRLGFPTINYLKLLEETQSSYPYRCRYLTARQRKKRMMGNDGK